MRTDVRFRMTLLSVLMCVFVISSVFAQQAGPQKWSQLDQRLSRINRAAEPVATQVVKEYKEPASAPVVYHTTSGTYKVNPSFRVHPTTWSTQSEVPITRHPLNGNILYGSANTVDLGVTFISEGMFLTTDGGTTWFGSDTTASATLSSHSGDPAPVITPTGTILISYLYGASTVGVGASRSTNMGATWDATDVLESGSSDKNHTFVDDVPTSPYYGRVYATWSDFTASLPPAVVSYSSDDGATWSPYAAVHSGLSGHYDQGVNGVVGVDGAAYIFWQNPVAGSPYTGDYLGMAKSTNGGVSWTTTPNIYDCNGIRGNLTSKGSIRVNDFPSAGIDKSNGPRRGWIYIVTAEQSLAPAGSDPDIILHRSTDNGATWSSGIRVNQDASNNGKIQYMPWLCVDDGGGVNVVYYDDRNTSSDSAMVYVSRSLDGGTTWTEIPIEDSRFKPASISGLATGYQGDYIGITYGTGKIWPYWASNRSGTYQAWTTSIVTTEGFGFVEGTVTSGGPLNGVNVDFLEPALQLPGGSNVSGYYFAGAKVDTPGTTANYTLRARKFGYLDYTAPVTITRGDTLLYDFSMTPAPGGTLYVHAHTSLGAPVRANVKVRFTGTEVVNDYTDSLTGEFSTPLPAGTYDVTVDPPSPYGTRMYNGTTIIASQTDTIDSEVRWVLEPSPLALTDTLGVGQSNTKPMLLTNTTPDSVQFRLSNDEAAFLLAKQQLFAESSPVKDPEIVYGKDEVDPRYGPENLLASGGPDAFGYVWLDSDGGGVPYSWVDITGVGTQITSWGSGTGDEGHVIVPLPFAFPFYGATYSSVKITTNGWVSFDVVSTSHTYSNTAIPTAADPNLGVFAFWDDLDASSSGGIYYYNDVANSQFIVQYNNVPHYTSGGPYTFEIILKASGEILCQYQTMGSPDNSASIGIENATGTVGLQTIYNNTYVHSNLALLFKVRGVDWLTHTPGVGVIPPSGTLNITNSFNATDLIPGTTYNANVYLDATHPDVSGSITIPASLRVEPLVGPGIAVTPLTKDFGSVIIGQSKLDSVKIRNIGTTTLTVSEISSTNAEFAVTPSSGSVASGDSLKVYITFSPLMPAGAKAGVIHILSDDPINDTVDVTLAGTAVGVPQFLASVDSLTKNLEGGTMDSIQFHVRNNGTVGGDYSARAVMYPHTLAANNAQPVILPMKLSGLLSPAAGNILLVSDNPGLASATEKGVDPSPAPLDALGASSSLIYRALVAGGFTVDTVAFATHNPATYSSYGLVIWSAGQSTATMFNDATKRTALINYVNSGGRVWVEGGEVGFVYRKSGTTTDLDPAFRRTILRDSTWMTDATTSGLVIYATGSPVFTTPNLITSPIAFTGTGWGVRDGMRLQPADAGTSKLAGWSVWTTQGPDSACMITHSNSGSPQTMFTSFAISGITDTNAARYLVQNIATYMNGGGGGGTANWLFTRPTSGTIPVGDSAAMYARFEATDPSVFNSPGEYLGHIEVAATNSSLADTLKVPARMFVIPPTGARLYTDSAALHYGATALFATKSRSMLVKNIGSAPLTITGINITDPQFSATPTSFTLNSLDTQRVTVNFTPLLAVPYSATLSFVSNDGSAPSVALSGNGIGVPSITVSPDSFYFNMPSGPDTTSQALKIKNPGTDTLHYTIDEVSIVALAAPPAVSNPPAVELPKGVEDVYKGVPVLLGSGGPDAFGYRWMDSDESGGPAYNWVDISSVGTAVSWSTGDGDEGHAIVSLPFGFPFYGASYNSVKITSNGWVSFDVASTSHTYSNTTIPNSSDPNLSVYGFWDDLDSRTSGGVYYYHDVANSQFIVEYYNVPHYSSGGPYTFEIILKQSGEIVCQYQTINSPDNSASIGIENSTGTIGLQTAYNASYAHANLALMFTSDLYPWMSTSATSGTIAPGDSQTVQVKAHPGLIANNTYNGKIRILGNTPDTATVPVRLDVVGGTPFVTVTYPNGGETFVVGQSYNITWNKNLVDSVKIEYSTNAGTSWTVIKASTPALTVDSYVHPKMRGREATKATMEVMGSYLWTIPNTPTTQALVRVSDAANASTADVSNAVFTITATPPAVWTSQTSGTTSALYSVSIVDDQVAWTVGVGGVARKTTDGGTTWQSLTALAADAHMIQALSATTALVCVNPSAGNDGRIYRTTDGGTTWTLVYQNTTTGAFMDAIHMFDALNGIAIGDPVTSQWVILRTTDGGASWTPSGTLAQTGTEAGWNNSFVWTDNLHGWFGTSNSRIYYTTDGGTTWAYGATPAANSYGVAMMSGTNGLAGFATGSVARTVDGGATWSAASTAGTGTVFPAGVTVPATRYWGTSGTTVYKTTDDGTTWTVDHSRAAAFDHIAFKAVLSANVVVGYAVGESGQISKYTEYLPLANDGVISGVKFADIDGDSVKDAGEPGLEGWTIYLTGAVTESTLTDATGAFSFDSLASGTYTLGEIQQSGWVSTLPAGGSYTISLGPSENHTGADFGNFKLGSISGMKWKDSNGNGVKDLGETGLAGWQIQAARLNGAPLSTTTDGSGNYTFAGLPADAYTISEVQQSGYTQTYPATPGTHAVVMVSGLDTLNLNFGNFYPDTAKYRTLTAESLALGADTKGKVGKYNKRKADKVEFLFSLVVPTSSVLNLEFSMDVKGTVENNSGDSIAAFTGKKPAAMTLPVLSGETIWVKGWGNKGKQVKVKYAFGTAKKVTLVAFTLNQPRLPMPNSYNLLYELYLQNAFSATGGLVVGTPVTGIDELRYGYVKMAKYADATKSLYQKGTIHNGTPRNFDLLGTKPFIKMQKNLQPSKHNNALFGELMALGVNIVSSAAGKTPVGLGELIYDNGIGGPLNGRTVAEIDSIANTYITYGTSGVGLSADSFYHVVRNINLAFSAPMDTVSFAGSLVLTGSRAIAEVSYLRPNFGMAPKTIDLSPLNPTEMPSTFELSQNYPNPFNPTTSIDFALPADGFVTMKVYDILGREVATIVNNEMMDEGDHTVDFAANELASGVYFYRLIVNVPMGDGFDDASSSQMETFSSIKKFVLMK